MKYLGEQRSWDGDLRQSKGVIQFTIREQTGVGSHVAAMEFQLEAPVEFDPERLEFRFTHRVRHDRAPVPPQCIDSYTSIGAQGV